MGRRSVLALPLSKRQSETLRLHRPAKAGPAAHFDRNEGYAYFRRQDAGAVNSKKYALESFLLAGGRMA
jgi:hypothetical protein